ncbi:MAG: SDR family oxidoreductase [Novosphingobium sp.]|nr:SDR family oxidoreductase [Novosphingobium sp.]
MSEISRRRLLAGTAAVAATAATTAPSYAKASVEPSLKGKSFLITGTSSGFGRLGALHYARLGAKVFATMRNLPRPEAEELEKIARDEKLDLHVLELDVLSDEQVTRAVAVAEGINGGPLDVLVNNAGINIAGPVEVQDMEATQLSFDTNVYGYLRMARAVLPGMRSRYSGLIVNVSSQQGRVIMPGGGIYSATKFAVESMCEQLAYEVVPFSIDVLIVEPGGFPTRIGENRARYTGELYERADERHKAGYPALVARMKPSDGPPRAWPGTPPDPMDVPKAIAEIAAMPNGTRPLRRAVHPGLKPQLEINRICRETQLLWTSNKPFSEWVRAVYD